MKKTFTLLSILCITLICLDAKAQDDKEYVKSYITLLGGLSFPSGNFGQANYNNNSAGFAKRGGTLGVDGAYYFYKNLAIGATFSFQDQGELSSNDAQTLANGYNTDFKKDNTEITATNRYQNVTLMGGPQYSFVYHKLTIDLRADAGIIKSSSTPSVAVVFDSSTITTQTLNQLSSGASAFAYGGSAGLRFSIGGNWDVGIRANYVSSAGFKIDNTNNPGTTGRFVTKLPVTLLETTAGITLHL